MNIDQNMYESIAHGTIEFPAAVYEAGALYPAIYTYLHLHKEFEIIFCVKGHVTVVIDDEPTDVSKGDLVFINPHQLHMIKSTYESGGLLTVIVFDLEMLTKTTDISRHIFHSMKNRNMKTSKLICKQHRLNAQLVSEYHVIFELMNSKPLFYDLKVRSLLLSMMHILLSNNELILPSAHAHNEKRLYLEEMKRVLKHIEENYAVDIRLEELAHLTNMSVQHFCRVFKSMAGVSAVDFIIRYRIEKASIMLDSTDMSIADISQNCGFESPSYFARQFKRHTHKTPSEFRKQNLLLRTTALQE